MSYVRIPDPVYINLHMHMSYVYHIGWLVFVSMILFCNKFLKNRITRKKSLGKFYQSRIQWQIFWDWKNRPSRLKQSWKPRCWDLSSLSNWEILLKLKRHAFSSLGSAFSALESRISVPSSDRAEVRGSAIIFFRGLRRSSDPWASENVCVEFRSHY